MMPPTKEYSHSLGLERLLDPKQVPTKTVVALIHGPPKWLENLEAQTNAPALEQSARSCEELAESATPATESCIAYHHMAIQYSQAP
jgi:hypothetical protein